MQFTADQIAMILHGKIEGDAMAAVSGFGKIEEAVAGQIAFLANPKYEEFLYSTQASIVIVNEALELKESVKATLIRVPDAYTAFATLLARYQQLKTEQLTGIQQPSFIAENATVGENIFVGAFSYIGNGTKIGNNVKIFQGVVIGDNVTIGDNCILHAGVKIYFDCCIGNDVTIHAGTVIGSDGFGFAPQSDGSLTKVPQIGNVVVGNHVEIGANCTIDRATMGSTVIKSGVKIDNLVQVAHNAEIGENTVLAGQSGVSGSSKIGKNVVLGGQAGIAGHLVIADGTRINGQSGVTKNIKKPNQAITGTPASEFSSTMRAQAATRSLPDIEKRLKDLEKTVEQLLAQRVNAE